MYVNVSCYIFVIKKKIAEDYDYADRRRRSLEPIGTPNYDASEMVTDPEESSPTLLCNVRHPFG